MINQLTWLSYEFYNLVQQSENKSNWKTRMDCHPASTNMTIILWCDCPYLHFFKFFWAGVDPQQSL